MRPSPEASLRLTVSERSDRFAPLTAQKVKRSWQLQRLPRLTEGSPVSPLVLLLQVNAGSFFVLFAYLTHVGLRSQTELNLTFDPPFCSRQWAFLNKQHGAEKSFLHSFHSVSVEQLHVWDCCVITVKIVDRDNVWFFVFLKKNRFRRTHSLTHYSVLLWVFHQVYSGALSCSEWSTGELWHSLFILM